MKATVLVVDDHAAPRHALTAELEDEGFGVVQAADGVEGWDRFCRHRPDVVVADLVMPRASGHELLQRIRRQSDVPVILFTAHGTMELAVAAFKSGADDFISSCETSIEDIVHRVGAAAGGGRSTSKLPELETRVVGASAEIQRVRSRMAGLAPLPNSVLVLGERGTGRTTVIRALHELGSSAGGELETIDCARFQVARGLPECSAVYLDGIEALPPDAQSFWADRLSAFEEEQFRDVPRVFASGHPIFQVSARLPFDERLRAILSRFSLELPPLRDRPEDVAEIADCLVRDLAARMNRKTELSEPARAYLANQVWPGNIVQMQTLLERAVAFCRERQIRSDLLRELMGDFEESLEAIRKHHSIREREDLIDVLEATGGNVTRAAERLGRSRGAIYRLIDKHGIPLVRGH